MNDPQPVGDVVSIEELRASWSDAWTPTVVEERPQSSPPPSVPARYAVDLDTLEQSKPVLQVRDWLDNYREGNGLLLVGPVGTGKSTLAGAIGRILGAPSHCSFWPVGAMIAAMKAEMDNPPDGYTVRAKIDRRAALILDDLGTELPTGWQTNVLTELVAQRYDQSLTLVATTNLTPRQLEDRLGERTVSRLHEMCELVQVTGADRRRL